jgi:hypothetical protein
MADEKAQTYETRRLEADDKANGDYKPKKKIIRRRLKCKIKDGESK